MHDDHAGHHSSDHNSAEAHSIISEKSIQDRLLTTLAGAAMVALFLTGVYWQMSPLPMVQAEEEHVHN